MNTLHKIIEDSIFFLARKGETIFLIIALRRFDLYYFWNFVLMNCYMDCWYKRKKKGAIMGED